MHLGQDMHLVRHSTWYRVRHIVLQVRSKKEPCLWYNTQGYKANTFNPYKMYCAVPSHTYNTQAASHGTGFTHATHATRGVGTGLCHLGRREEPHATA